MPAAYFSLNQNFCRNTLCAAFGTVPVLGAAAGSSNAPRGRIETKNGISWYLVCATCGKSSILHNNRAIAEEYRRLSRLRRAGRRIEGCPDPICAQHVRPIGSAGARYQRHGTTRDGDPRHRCCGCGKTFSTGSPIRRQKRSSANGLVLRLLVSGAPLSKIADITGLAPRDVYAKIDFIHAQAQAFVAKREGLLGQVDWNAKGARFATDMQTLTLNWPHKKTRASVAVQHLCTAHANSGFIVAASLQLDLDAEPTKLEAAMIANGDFTKPRSHRRHGRIWSASEFEAYLDSILNQASAPKPGGPHPGTQLPHAGGLVRQDVFQDAHALLLRRVLRRVERKLIFVGDADPGLAAAFISAFADRIAERTADIVTVRFDKGMVNDRRNQIARAARQNLASALGVSLVHLDMMQARQLEEGIDGVVAAEIRASGWSIPRLVGGGYRWPFDSKSEPNRKVSILTARPGDDPDRIARLLRLGTLRSVDAYFHKVRSNLRAASRAGTSSTGRKWDRYYYYRPETLLKVIDIFRFFHNWMGSPKSKTTPAMRLGLARGKIYERDLFSFR